MQCCADIDELGTLLPLATGLKSQGVKCFSTLAIGTPQTEPSDRRCEELAGRVFGTEPTLGQISSLRCLHFEAPTLIVATLMKSDSTDPGSLVKNLRQVLSAALHLHILAHIWRRRYNPLVLALRSPFFNNLEDQRGRPEILLTRLCANSYPVVK